MQYSKQKDAHPSETIEKIKEALAKADISVQETDWIYINDDPSVQLVHTKRVFIENEAIGANGKGTTPEYGLASAYAELIERIQNTIMSEAWNIKIPDRKKVPQDYFLKKHPKLVDEKFFRYLNQKDARYSIDKDTPLPQIISRLHGLANLDPHSDIECIPFFNVRKKDVNYLPWKILTRINTSNGMAAGNTPEEALIQGFCEIIERYVQKTVYIKKLCPPLIPESEYLKYKTIRDLIFLYNEFGIKVQVRDASLGQNWPTICVVFIDRKNGLYTTKFATSPSFPIAIERCLTEYAQCHNFINQAISMPHYPITAEKDFFDYNTLENYDIFNTYTFALKNSTFKNESSWNYNHSVWSKFDESSNKINLGILTDLILEKSFDIYVRDVSFLGFPSYHIHIPEMSNFISNIALQLENEINALRKYWPNDIPAYAFEYAIHHSIKHTNELNLAISLSKKSYEEAEKFVNNIAQSIPDEATKMPLYCIKEYIKLKQDNWSDDDAKKVLTEFYGEPIVEQIFKYCIESDYLGNVTQQIFNNMKIELQSERSKIISSALNNLTQKLTPLYKENTPDQTKLKEIFK